MYVRLSQNLDARPHLSGELDHVDLAVPVSLDPVTAVGVLRDVRGHVKGESNLVSGLLENRVDHPWTDLLSRVLNSPKPAAGAVPEHGPVGLG
jgi:hypothetical protein